MSFLKVHLSASMLVASVCLSTGALCVTTNTASADVLTVSLAPRSEKDTTLLSSAIGLYALHRDLRMGADVRQVGTANAALLHQSGQGQGQRAIIRQRGTGHSARLSQSGQPNAQVILQFGRGAEADIVQNGGQSGILVQFRR